MNTEGIDIVVTKTGADEAAVAIKAIGEAGSSAAVGVEAVNSSVNFMKETIGNAESRISAFNNTANYSETVLKAIERAATRSNVTMEEYARKMEAAAAFTDKAKEAQQQATQQIEHHTEATTKANESTHALTESSTLLKEALGALGLIFTAAKVLEVSEAYQKTDIQLRSVSASAKDLIANQERLQQISQLTGSSYEANVKSFQKLTIETQGLGVSQKDLLTTIQNVDAVVQESGGTSREAAQAVDLFGRALATGTVSGRQFRTLLLNFPQLGQLAAQGLNTTTSALVSMSQKAGTSSREFVAAFNRAAAAANVAGKEIELTLGGSIQVLQNAVLLYIGRFETANGLTQALAHSIQFLGNNFSAIAAAIEVAITAFASFYGIMVLIPGILAAAAAGMRLFTAAVLANPFLAMIAAITTVITLIYEFGNSIKLTTDGSITLLGAFIGTWNVLKNVLTGIWAFVSGPLTAAWNVFFEVVSAPFRLLGLIIQGVVAVLDKLGISLGGLAGPIQALLSPITTFKNIMSDAMTDATTKLNATTDSTKQLAAALDGDPNSLSASADKATKSVTALTVAGTQMGRVNAEAIPAFTNLADAARRSDEAIKSAAENMKRYSAEVDNNAKKAMDLSVTTRDAMGNIIKYTNEAANQTGSSFNSMKDSIDSVTASLNAEAAAAQRAAQATSSAASAATTSSRSMDINNSHAQHTNAMLENGVSTDGGQTFHSAQEDIDNFKQYGRPLGNAVSANSPVAWNELVSEAGSDTALVAMIKAAAHAKGIPGFSGGGTFDVGGAGGTDSQLVQFMASPDERVTVETPAQQRAHLNATQAGGGKSIIVNMDIRTPDPGAFRRSQNQMLLDLRSRLNGV